MRLLVPLVLSLVSMACSSRMAVHDVKAVATSIDWKTTAVAAGAVGATLLVDDEIASLARRNDSPAADDLFEAIEPFGGSHSDKVMAGFLLHGLIVKNERSRHVAFDAFVSSIIASKGITPALKALIPRTRPHGTGDDESFPSNHATQAFAVASVIATHYDERPWVRRLAYGIATGVALARVYHDDHFASDVLAGAVIGTYVGNTVARTNRALRIAPARDGVMIAVDVSALFRGRFAGSTRPSRNGAAP
ncbi:MAG TPA: phosphatase PAP2 family protein [Thermoanaerobaculia bacterium]|nr:phosphatase PAP2 family protein [Thermoanaerobaculia bacterium]